MMLMIPVGGSSVRSADLQYQLLLVAAVAGRWWWLAVSWWLLAAALRVAGGWLVGWWSMMLMIPVEASSVRLPGQTRAAGSGHCRSLVHWSLAAVGC
jgi:hypothetical protein